MEYNNGTILSVEMSPNVRTAIPGGGKLTDAGHIEQFIYGNVPEEKIFGGPAVAEVFYTSSYGKYVLTKPAAPKVPNDGKLDASSVRTNPAVPTSGFGVESITFTG